MEQLSPTEQFPITYVLGDPNDAGTYYVQAVIYDDVAGTTIETVNLTDLGSGRFKKLWYVCSDVSGQGKYISIVCKVYTDSGYTTLADSYQQKENKYLVQERLTRGSLGGGGPSFSYKEIRKIFQEELGGIPKTEILKPKETDMQPVVDALTDLKNDVRAIPKPDKVDLSGLIEELKRTRKKFVAGIESIHIPEPEKLDLSPVLEKMDKFDIDRANEDLGKMIDRVREFFMDDIEKVITGIEELKKKFDDISLLTLASLSKPLKPNDKDEEDI